MSDPSPAVVLYGRRGCHLCEDARELLGLELARRAAAGLAAPRLELRDIEDDEAWLRRHHATIPVVEVAGRELPLAVDPGAIARHLAAALDPA